jgi:hypothetical protein
MVIHTLTYSSETYLIRKKSSHSPVRRQRLIPSLLELLRKKHKVKMPLVFRLVEVTQEWIELTLKSLAAFSINSLKLKKNNYGLKAFIKDLNYTLN